MGLDSTSLVASSSNFKAMNTYNQRPVDCKSSIESSILSRASNTVSYTKRGKNSPILAGEVVVSLGLVNLPVSILMAAGTGKLALKFTYKSRSHTIFLNCSLTELSEEEVGSFVKAKIREVDGAITLSALLDFVTDSDDCGGNLTTRKKNVAHFKDFCKRDGISLDETLTILLREDDLGRTLPERWQALFNLPHKLRQVRSLFSRKNIVLFKRKGWDTSSFGNFVVFVPESTVSQPFTTTDEEVERIINFFQENRERHPVFYDIYLLAFGAGLRASEIYQVKKENFTTFNGQHFLLLPFATKRSKLKGTNHTEKVGISPKLYDHFTDPSRDDGEVVKGALRLHKRFIKFLKTELGITENKACHRLRKILGARLATTHGIYHAAKTLRNSVGVAEKYYSDLTAHRNELEV